MANSIKALPTLQEAITTLDEFMREAYTDVLIKIPKEGRAYTNRRGQPITRNGKKVPKSSGRLYRSIQPPSSKVTLAAISNTSSFAGKMSITVADETLYDPVMNERYWPTIAYSATTPFGNANKLQYFWRPAVQILKGKILEYKHQYATYRPASLGRMTEDELRAHIEEEDAHYLKIRQQAEEEDLL